MKCVCSYCGKENNFESGKVNRAKKVGLNIYCNRTCAGLGRRRNLTIEEKKKEKANYDREYRNKNWEYIKQQQKLYNESPAGRAMQKRFREKRKDYHKTYIKTDSYRKYKQEYDKQYHAKQNYGEFYEAAIALFQLEQLIIPERLEAKIQNGLLSKSQKRKRLWNSLQKI